MDAEQGRPVPVPTGDPRVDQAVQGLASLDELDLADRPAVLQDVHGQLRDILGELGEAGFSAPPGAGRGAEPGHPGPRGEPGGGRR